MTNDSVVSTVLALPYEDRVDLVETILQSLHSEITPQQKAEWVRVANERFAAYERGEMKTFSREEVMLEIKAKYSK